MATSVVFPRVQFFANNGRPLIGGRIHTYVAGSSTRARTYKDAAKAQPNANPIILDARGEASVYLAEGVEYKFVIEDSTGALIMTQEPVYGAIWPNAAEWPSDATLSYQYMTEAKAAASAIGPVKFYDTKAQADAAIGTMANGDIIEVAIDETRAAARTRYKVQAGVLVFVVNLDQVRVDLAASTGAGLVGFARSSGPAQTVQQHLDMLYYGIANVRDTQFAGGAKGDWNGTTGTDDTAAIQAAINSTNGFVHIPPGRYRITAALNINGKTTSLLGAGMQATEIVCTATNSKILNFTGQWGGFKHLSLGYSGTPISGATAVYSTSANLVGENFHIKSCHIGIEIAMGPAQYFSRFFIDNYVHVGIFAHDINDCYFDQFILDAKNATNGALGGIRMIDKAEAMIFTQGGVLKGVYGMTTDAAIYNQGVRPAYNKFHNVYFDSPAQGVSLDKMVETAFSNCWFSGGRSGAGFPGCKLLQTDSITFNAGSNFFNCGSHGLHITSASARAVVADSFADSNSITAGAGAAHGIYVDANTSDFMLIDNVSRNGLYTGGQQGYGIYIAAGTSARYQVRGNNLAGNSTGPMFDGGTGALSRVSDNIGYNPVGWGSIAVGASPYTYFSGNTRETIYITGGTVLGVNLPGGAIFGAGSERTIHLEPGEQVSVFYTATPTMTKFRH